MKSRIILTVLALVFSTSFSHLSINNTVSLSQPATVVSVDPPHTNIQLIDDFAISISVTNVTNLQSYEIRLSYDDKYLAYRGADANDSLLVRTNASYDHYFLPKLHGEVVLDLSLRENAACNGSGTLVTVKFQGIKEINLGHLAFDAKLKNATRDEIDFTKADGTYTVKERTTIKQISEDYTLLADVSFREKYLFRVIANDVVLDLNNRTIRGGGDAIAVTKKSSVTIKNGSIVGFQLGIEIIECDLINISHVKVLNSRETAIKIVDSRDVHICDSTVSYSSSLSECITISGSNFTEVSHNVLSNNEFYGIDIEKNSAYTTISCNTISNNTPGGINIDSSNYSTIFNNNFINNTDYDGITPKHVKSDAASINAWNGSYPHGGNYWDDWNATTRQPQIVDEKCGENRSDLIPGPDGIGDTPYVINRNDSMILNQDWYPLVNPYDCVLQVRNACRVLMERNKIRTLSVAVFTNSSVADLNFDETLGLISFSVSGNCTSCKVIVSKGLLDGAFETKVDGTPAASSLIWDEGAYDYGCIFISFNYSSGNHKVRIRGEMVRRCDLNNDGRVDIIDITLIAKEYGYKYIYEILKRQQD